MYDPDRAYLDGLAKIEQRLQELRDDGRKLQERRTARKLTVTRLAVFAGVSEDLLAAWERGAIAPTPHDRTRVEALLSAWEHEGRFFSRHPARSKSALPFDTEHVIRERLLGRAGQLRSA